ncbi:hypothetical protein GCM10009797_32350 [Nocardioides hwasunensis]
MTPDEQLELFAAFDEDELFSAALQLMRRIHDAVVYDGEEAVHGDLPSAIDDLELGPWQELDQPLIENWPYAVDCELLSWLLRRLEDASSGDSAVVTARSLLRPGGPKFWARG